MFLGYTQTLKVLLYKGTDEYVTANEYSILYVHHEVLQAVSRVVFKIVTGRRCPWSVCLYVAYEKGEPSSSHTFKTFHTGKGQRSHSQRKMGPCLTLAYKHKHKYTKYKQHTHTQSLNLNESMAVLVMSCHKKEEEEYRMFSFLVCVGDEEQGEAHLRCVLIAGGLGFTLFSLLG